MNNKLLITIIMPDYEFESEFYIPNNKKIGTIKSKIIKFIEEILQIKLNKTEKDLRFINRETGQELENDMCIKDSRIKNGSIILLI